MIEMALLAGVEIILFAGVLWLSLELWIWVLARLGLPLAVYARET